MSCVSYDFHVILVQVLRVFEAPKNFVGNLKRILNVDLIDVGYELNIILSTRLHTMCTPEAKKTYFFPCMLYIVTHTQTTKELPLGATVPSLGLSNKAVFNCKFLFSHQHNVMHITCL